MPGTSKHEEASTQPTGLVTTVTPDTATNLRAHITSLVDAAKAEMGNGLYGSALAQLQDATNLAARLKALQDAGLVAGPVSDG